MKKKVLIFALTYYPNQISGAEAAIKEITERIPGIEFHMVTNRYDADIARVEQVGNVLVHRIGITKKGAVYEDQGKIPLTLNKPLYQFLAAWKALQLHRRYRYDGIWALMAHSAGVPAAIFKLFHPRVPYLLTLQEGDPIPHIEKKMKPLWPLFTRAFTKTDAIQAISIYLADWARARNATCPISLIHNAANPAAFAETDSIEELNALKLKLGKKDDDIYLVNTARLVPQKAFDIVIRALPSLPGHVKFLIVGGGSDEEMLRSLVAELNLESRVIFTGPVEREVVTAYRRVSDIFVMPSRSEGLGNAGLSAMASRLPVIATQEGGLAEYVFGEKENPDKDPTAWVVRKDNSEDIVKAVNDILENPDKVKRITENARQMIEDEYNWDSIATRMKKEIFDGLFEN